MSKNSPNKTGTLSKPGKGGVSCSVVLLDGETLDVPLDKNDIGRVLFDKVCQHLDLLEGDYFGFTYSDDRGPSHLKYWLNLDKKISKVKKVGAWVFDFAVKFYPPDPAQLKESLTRWLMVLQIRRDLLSGRLPCTFTTYALLGSYNVQAEVGEYDPTDHGHSSDYIRNMFFAPNQTPELLEKIAELHKQHKGQTPDEAEKCFLDNAKKLAMYGIDLHKAKDADNNAVMVGVCASGLIIFRGKLRINRFVWPKITKLSYKRNHFYTKLRPGELEKGEANIMFKLDSHRLAKRLWKTCVEHHAFFRLRESDKEQKNIIQFGSKFRYSGRTLYQSRQTAALMDRPPPFFERTNSRNSYEDSANRSQSMDELGRKKRLQSIDSCESSMYGGDTLNRTREYNMDADPSEYSNSANQKWRDMDGNTLQRRPFDSLDRSDRVPHHGDSINIENPYDSGTAFRALNGDKGYKVNPDDPVQYRYNKDGGEYPFAYPCDLIGKEYAYDKFGNKYGKDGMVENDPKRYRFDHLGQEFQNAYPVDINGKEYPFDRDGNRYPEGKDGLRYRFDKDGKEYPYGFPFDSAGKEYPYDRDGNTYPYGIDSDRFSYDTDGKRYRYDKDGNEYLQGFPYDRDGKSYPYDQDGNRFPYGGDGLGYVFDQNGCEYPLGYPLDHTLKAYPYDALGNKCPSEGFRFDKSGNEYPHAYPFDSEGVEYAYDAEGNRYPQDQYGKDLQGYVYDRDGKKYRFDQNGREYPGGFPYDAEGKEYPYNKQGLRYPHSLAASEDARGFRYDEAGQEYPLAYPHDCRGNEYAFDSEGNRYPQDRYGQDVDGYVYDRDGDKYRFDENGKEFPGGVPYDRNGKEYPYNKEGLRFPTPMMTHSYDVDGKKYRYDNLGNEFPTGYPFDKSGLEYPYDRDGNKCPNQGYRFDADGNEYAQAYPFDAEGNEYPYDSEGNRYPVGRDGRDRLGYVFDKDGKKYRFDKNGKEYPLAYPHDRKGVQYPFDKDGNRCPYDGFRFDSNGREYPHGYPFDREGREYPFDIEGNRFPQDKDGKDRLGYVYDKDGKRYRFDREGREYPHGRPFDRAGVEYPYDKDGLMYGSNRKPGDTFDGIHPYANGLALGASDKTGVVGDESQVDNVQKFEPLPQEVKETKDKLKGQDNLMPFFQPNATSTVGRNSRGPPPPLAPKPNHSHDDSFNYKTEKDGVEQTRVVQKVTMSGDEDDFDFDAALADAIRSVTEFNPDMSVERIECVQQIEDVNN